MTSPNVRTIAFTRPTLPLAGAAIVIGALLTACSGGSTATTSTEPASIAPTGSPAAAGAGAGAGGPGRPGGVDPAQLQKIQQCLTAAGMASAIPSGRPSVPSGFPSGVPSGFPSGVPSGFPSGMPVPGAGAAAFADPKVRAALQACGITLPGTAAVPSS